MKLRKNGFTLLEVIVSMSIMALVFLAMFRCIQGVILYSNQTEERFRLSLQLRKFQSRILSRGFHHKDLSSGSHSEESEDFKIQWRVDVKSTGLKKVNVRITRNRCFCKGEVVKSIFF